MTAGGRKEWNMYHAGRRKRFWAGVLAAGMLAVFLLSGCSSAAVTPGNPSDDSLLPGLEEGQDEEKGQELTQNLLAWLILDDSSCPVSTDENLNSVAAMLLDYVLLNPEFYLGSDNLNDLLILPKQTYAAVYDGSMPASQVGIEILEQLKDWKAENEYAELSSLTVLYGQGKDQSVWLVLAHYTLP